MNISVTAELSNDQIKSFSNLEETAYRIGLDVGCQIIKMGLEMINEQVNDERDKEQYRNKGLRQTCIKTKCGEVVYSRNVYVDKQAKENEKRHVYLLDEYLQIEKIGAYTKELCRQIANAVCVVSYRETARKIRESCGASISAQGAWNIVQILGKGRQELTERNAQLAKENQGKGDLQTKILYEENDGVWLKLQGESREKYGRSKEMKVGIAYDGALWEIGKDGKKRRTLDNKISYAGFMPITDFRKNKEGVISSRFAVDEIELRVINGDGAGWIQKQKGTKTISVLDKFHRNKKIRECVKNEEYAKTIWEHLHKGEYDELLEYVEALINSVEDEGEKNGLEELQRYYSENKEALAGYYDRGIDIPETRKPGEIHHARLGSMESNIFTLIGNRMKNRRHCWSIRGANNLALLLCAYHTTGLEDLFAPLPAPPVKEEEWIDDGKALSADKTPEADGLGYEFPQRVSGSNEPTWLKEIGRMDLSFMY